MKYAVIAALAAATVSGAACPATLQGGEYKDDKCTQPVEDMKFAKPTEKELATYDGECKTDDTLGTSLKAGCTDEAITVETWTKKACEGKADGTKTIKLNECFKPDGMDTYVKLTGATAIKAAAFAVAAFAASQF